MSWSQASTTTGFYSGMNYSAADLGGFTGSLAMGHMAYLANKKNTQIATDAALKEMGHETDSEGNPLGKDPLSKVENFLVGMYESICGGLGRLRDGASGLLESFGNLVGGKGFRTDSEVDQRKAELLAEYNRVKDMTLLAGNGDANMSNAAEAAEYKEKLIKELMALDPNAAKDAYATSTVGKLELMKKEALLKREVAAALKDFDADLNNDKIKQKDGTIVTSSGGNGGVTIARDKYGRITSVTDNSLDMTQAVINKFDKNNNTLNTIEQTYNMNGGQRGNLASEMIFQDNEKVVLKYGDSGKITGWEFYKKSEHADFYEAVDVNQKFIDAMKSKVGTEYTWGGGNMTAYKGKSNLNSDGTWRGYDCCGSVVESMRNALDMNMKQFNSFNVTGLYNADFMENTSVDENGNVVFMHYNGVTADPGHVMVYNEWTDENGKKYDIMSTHGDVKERTKTVLGITYTYYEEVNSGDRRFGARNAGLLSTKDTKAGWQAQYVNAEMSMKKINWGEVYKKYKLK